MQETIPHAASETTVQSPELRAYQNQITAIKRDAGDLLSGMTEAAFLWRPHEGMWSIGECLAHLNVTNRLYMPRIEAAMAKARSRAMFGTDPFKHSFVGNLLVRLIEPPPRRKVKAPRVFLPPSHLKMSEEVAGFMNTQDLMLDLIGRADGLHLSHVKLASPVTRFLKFSLGQAFALTCAHERRHLWQARRVREDANFPINERT